MNEPNEQVNPTNRSDPARDGTAAAEEMAHAPGSARAGVSRLGFLTRASAGAVAIGAMSSMPALVGTADTAEVDTSSLSAETLDSPLVAHVSDITSGEVTVMSGLRELTVRDPQLIMRLLRALAP